jgi:hypothetical protein
LQQVWLRLTLFVLDLTGEWEPVLMWPPGLAVGVLLGQRPSTRRLRKLRFFAFKKIGFDFEFESHCRGSFPVNNLFALE